MDHHGGEFFIYIPVHTYTARKFTRICPTVRGCIFRTIDQIQISCMCKCTKSPPRPSLPSPHQFETNSVPHTVYCAQCLPTVHMIARTIGIAHTPDSHHSTSHPNPRYISIKPAFDSGATTPLRRVGFKKKTHRYISCSYNQKRKGEGKKVISRSEASFYILAFEVSS